MDEQPDSAVKVLKQNFLFLVEKDKEVWGFRWFCSKQVGNVGPTEPGANSSKEQKKQSMPPEGGTSPLDLIFPHQSSAGRYRDNS